MKKYLALCLAFVVLLFTFAGCTKVGEEQISTPPATEAPAKTPAPEGTNADGTDHEPYAIEIYTMPSGTTTYIMGVALADIINQNSSWLTATALSSQSVAANATTILDGKETTAIGSVIIPQVVNGLPPFEESNTEFRSIASFSCQALSFITLDPELKTLQDLDGKNVMLGTPGSYLRKDIPELMFKNLGITPNYSYGGFTDAATALMDGNVDAIYIGGTALNADLTEWATHSSLAEVAARYTLYYIGIDEEAYNAAEKEFNFSTKPDPMLLPAGTYDPNFNEDLWINPDNLDWVCHEDMPDDVVEEIIRVMSENAEDFVNYLPAGGYISLENMAKVSVPEYTHPAAQAFYEENGVWPY